VILDYITNHPDRRPDNWLVERKGGRYHLRGIDNGVNWVSDRNLPPGWRQANDPIYFAVELARAGFSNGLSPHLRRRLARTNKEAWRAELQRYGLSEAEITDSLRALDRVQREGLRAVFTSPRGTAPAALVNAGRALFR
jgi:hypothetical protein